MLHKHVIYLTWWCWTWANSIRSAVVSHLSPVVGLISPARTWICNRKLTCFWHQIAPQHIFHFINCPALNTHPNPTTDTHARRVFDKVKPTVIICIPKGHGFPISTRSLSLPKHITQWIKFNALIPAHMWSDNPLLYRTHTPSCWPLPFHTYSLFTSRKLAVFLHIHIIRGALTCEDNF